jgi:hypothetical protein
MMQLRLRLGLRLTIAAIRRKLGNLIVTESPSPFEFVATALRAAALQVGTARK